MLSILAGVVLVGVIALAVGIRLMPVRPETHHVDPATITPPTSPNFALRRGEGAASLAASLEETADRLTDVLTAAGGQPLAGDLAAGHASFVFRSRLMGFPDVVSIRLRDASARERLPEGALTEIDIYSRALLGYSDLGVNRARVDALLTALAP